MECASKKEKVYRPRHPEKTPFYSVLFHYFDRFVGEYDLRFDKHYGKWRAVMAYVVAKYLDCGIYNRKLLTELSRCAWKAIRQYFDVCSPEGTLPGGILSIATAVRLGGSTGILIFMHWFPQELSMQTDPLLPLSCLPKNVLRELFEAYVYKLLVSKELIGRDLIAKMRPPRRRNTADFMFMQDPQSRKRKMPCAWDSILCALRLPHPDYSLQRMV